MMNSISSLMQQYANPSQNGFAASRTGGNFSGRMPEGIQSKLQEAGISSDMRSKIEEKIKSKIGEMSQSGDLDMSSMDFSKIEEKIKSKIGEMSQSGGFDDIKANMESFHAKLKEAGMVPGDSKGAQGFSAAFKGLESKGYSPQALLSQLEGDLSLESILQRKGNVVNTFA